MPFHRYVALGDSFAEGVGDPHPTASNGLRGWADRVAAVLAQQTQDFGYANLAIRGRKLDAVIAEQVEPAVALEPDLVTIYAGGNDIMRPKVDIDALVERSAGILETAHRLGVSDLGTSRKPLFLHLTHDPAAASTPLFWGDDTMLIGLTPIDGHGREFLERSGASVAPGASWLDVDLQSVVPHEIGHGVVDELVPEIDEEARRVVVDPPPGLLELGEDGA